MKHFLVAPPRFFLILECAVLFLLAPALLYLHPTRLNVHGTLWLVTAYAAFVLQHTPGFSWRMAWQGNKLSSRDFKLIAVRFVLATIGIIFLTTLLQPDRLLSFPLQRPGFWLIVMLLYPLLSALPQELVFRSFFFHRYQGLFPHKMAMLAATSFVFGFIHIVFHNPVSPLLSAVCGFFIGGSYFAHRSLKRAALEHALYGDMVFTVGLGLYFLVGSVSIMR